MCWLARDSAELKDCSASRGLLDSLAISGIERVRRGRWSHSSVSSQWLGTCLLMTVPRLGYRLYSSPVQRRSICQQAGKRTTTCLIARSRTIAMRRQILVAPATGMHTHQAIHINRHDRQLRRRSRACRYHQLTHTRPRQASAAQCAKQNNSTQISAGPVLMTMMMLSAACRSTGALGTYPTPLRVSGVPLMRTCAVCAALRPRRLPLQILSRYARHQAARSPQRCISMVQLS